MYSEIFVKAGGEFQQRLNAACNYEPPQDSIQSGFSRSPYLNIYGYPLELDYQDIVPLPSDVIQVDAFCRKMPEPFTIPKELNYNPAVDKLVYVSMGPMVRIFGNFGT